MRFLFFKHFFIRKTAVQFVQFRSNSTSTAITFDMLRSYQKECIKTTLREYKEGHNRQIVSLPVGKVCRIFFYIVN
jgi:superfamily II DNA or RNA helicase